MRRPFIVAAAVVPLLAVAAPASAAKPAPASYSIALDQAAPALGDVVTFTANFPNTARNPRVQVVCSQDDAVVYGEAGPADFEFTLGGYWSPWLEVGGPASCVATSFDLVWRGNTQVVTFYAETAFNAEG